MSNALEEAYDQTAFEVIEQGNLELPTSTPAVFEYNDDGDVTDASQARNAIESGDFALIAPHTKNGDDGQFYLSSKVYAAETNEFLHVKMGSSNVRVFPKDEDFSFETLTAIVEQLETALGTTLQFTDQEEED